MQRADIVIARPASKPIKPQWVRKGQVIFALSNPDPEIEPLVAREQGAAFAADGKGITPAGLPGTVQRRARSRCAAFLGRHADGRPPRQSPAFARGELVPTRRQGSSRTGGCGGEGGGGRERAH